MKPQSPPTYRRLLTPLLLTAATSTLHAQIAMDGVRNASDNYAQLSVQATASNWGGGNTLANLHAVQEGSSLGVFVGGRANGNAFILFIDTKAGGLGFIPNNLITSGGEEYTINNLGSSSTAGMVFEDGFTPDYAVRIYGTGSDAYVNTYDLQTGARGYFGQSGGTTLNGSGYLAAIRTTWTDVADSASHANGVELKINLQQAGVPALDGQTVKMMAILVNGGSNYASNQVLGSRTSSTADIGGGRNSINFQAEAGTQTISTVVNLGVPDNDQDGIADADDPDDDNDGLADTVETDTGIFVDANDTGTNPLVADTDGDGVNDGAEVTAGTNPLKTNHAALTVAGSFLNPAWTPAPGNGNDMSPVAGDEFGWTLDKEFFDLNAYEGKITAGSWALNWGSSGGPGVLAPNGGNIAFQATTYGIWRISFNTDTLAFSFERATYPDYAAFATAYALTGTESGDNDLDGFTNLQEFVANTHPVYSDTDGDGISDGVDLYPLVDDNTDGDLDNDGLLDEAETNTGVFVDENNTGTDPNSADSDGDGYTDYNEVYGYSNLGFVSDPNIANYGIMAVPGNLFDTNPDDGVDMNWRPDGSGGNAMARLGDSLADQHQWTLTHRVLTLGTYSYKYAAGSWDRNWGSGAGSTLVPNGGNLSAVFNATGFHTFSFNSATFTHSLVRTEFADVSAYLTAYGLDADPDADADGDGVSNSGEFTANTDPTRADTDGDGVSDAIDSDPLQSSRDITFSVDMAVVITNAGFDPATDSVVVKFFSGVQSGQPDLELTQVGETTVYSGTLTDVAGAVGTSFGTYKFFNSTEGAPNSGYEFGSDRTFNLGAANEAQVLETVYFSNEAPPSTETRDVTFSVDMSVQIANAEFDPATQGVEVRGSFNSFAGGSSLADDDGDRIYTGTLAITGDAGTNIEYKFYGTGEDGLGYETMSDNRSAQLGTADEAQVLDKVYFNNLTPPSADSRQVEFSVNMNVQITNAAFDPATENVQVRGPFNGWAGTILSDLDGDGIYTGSVLIEGDEGDLVEYKFFSSGALSWESLSNNRVLSLETANVNQVLDTVYFNNQTPPSQQFRNVTFSIDMSVQITNGAFNSATDGVEVRGPFNGWSGTALTALGNGVYFGVISVQGDEGASVEYKFFSTGTLSWESVDNRSFTLGVAGTPQFLGTAYFNNQEPPPPSSGFSDWADANAGGGAFDGDFDGDGIPNGTEYFFGETTPGPTVNPLPDADGLIIWPRDPNATGVSFRIDYSTDLAGWTDVTADADLTDPDEIRYTLDRGVGGGFVRLVVIDGGAGND
ncbi:MAG: hypothetical protein FJ385_04440 [Verrucomicrobia bacterium]|nr:hypothetical protein [Verrucomicrobiota bacterium]